LKKKCEGVIRTKANWLMEADAIQNIFFSFDKVTNQLTLWQHML